MKLYFYIFDGNKMTLKEVKVRETNQKYYFLEEAPIHGKYLLKSKIGLNLFIERKMVILENRNDQEAKNILCAQIEKEIMKKQSELNDLKRGYSIIEKW